MANRLADESSPYLLQHANNPVDWYPWCEEALGRARDENKPIFLSIGYSACHWCHVMEHESFENAAIAQQMNERFVCIKVDREERPDLDQIYMHAVQMMTGRGGWPMSVFLTPDLQPFFGGTYWPPTRRMNMPGFDEVLAAVDDAWTNRRPQAIEQARQLTESISSLGADPPSQGALDLSLLQAAVSQLQEIFDHTHGGFGSAPKFPHPMDLMVILRVMSREPNDMLSNVVRVTLDKMAAGGIYDHLGGGFARYSVDERWLVPHFEKMLYDNSLLANAYLDAYLFFEDPEDERVVRETLDYLLRDMTDPAGGFYSTEDADSEGVEGKFYVWDRDEIMQLLGPEVGERFCYVYAVTDGGNFEGKNILNRPHSLHQCCQLKGWDEPQLRQELTQARSQLLAVREQRVRPGRDDKVIVSWNGLAIEAFARAARVFGESQYQRAAESAAEFVYDHLRQDDGRLLHCWRKGTAKFAAYLDDYTMLANSLVELYEMSFNERWIDWAFELANLVLAHFSDPGGGALFYTADDHESLIARTKELHDNALPSSNAVAATMLMRLGKLCGHSPFLEAAESILNSSVRIMQRAPAAAGQMLIALDLYLGPFHEIAVIGDRNHPDVERALGQLNHRFIPRAVVACRSEATRGDESSCLDPLFDGKEPGGQQPTVFVCRDFACQAPIVGKQQALAAWDALK